MPGAAGIVLAGGASARMGTAKAALEWHGSTLVRRVTGVLARAVGGPVVVVRAAAQPLPPLASGVEVIEDPRAGLGPVQGIAAGLAAVAGRAEFAFVCATDMPFLHPMFVRAVLAAAGGETGGNGPGTRLNMMVPGAARPDAVLPVAGGYPQPLAAAYRTALAAEAGRRAAAGQLRLGLLLQDCAVRRLDEDALLGCRELAALDPGLESLINLNTPEDYARARARPAPEITVASGAPAGGAARPARAATLAQAAAAAGPGLPLAATVRGRGATTAVRTDDGEFPLVSGDQVRFGP
jgi:molybdenum cofactor guanylyltransferase